MAQINTLIKPTHECNLRCRYCFAEKYGYDKLILDMKKLKKYIDILTDKYDYVNLVWHGGEPLMVPLDYYEEIYDYCKKVDSKFIFSIQTNGTLLNQEKIDFFKENNTSIGLSFDGLTNDKTRSNANIILDKIKLLQSNEIYPGAVMVINKNNVNNLIDEYEYFKLLSVGIKMNPMFNDGAAKKNSFLNLDPDVYIHEFINFFKYWAMDPDCNINVSTCIELVNLVINEYSNTCTFNSCLMKWLCLDSNGHIYPCDRLCMEQFDLGDIDEINSIDEVFYNKNFVELMQMSISRRQKCIDNCEYFRNCYGGCNANAILNLEHDNNISCYIQKEILREIKKFIIELNEQKKYDNLNYSLSKILKKGM